MKLFIKFILITIYHKKYINWKKLNQDIGMSLAGSRLLFHPEQDPFRKIFNNKELKTLLED